MKTTIKDLVRAAVAYRDADTYGGVHGTRQPLLDAADTLDTSGEVVISRALAECLKVAAWHRWSDSGIEEYREAHDDICAALKEQP